MAPKATFFLLTNFICVLTTLICHSCDAQTTVRPYKFGFTIDEQQHRYEKRDEKGIVMGEFGFITADGIYHVTVYATDEEGRFRILAMKNYPYKSPPKTIDMVIAPKKKPITEPPPIVTTTQRPKFNFGQEACSGCFLTNKNDNSDDQEKKRKTDIRPLSKSIPQSSESPTTANAIPGTSLHVRKMITDIAEAATNQIILKPKNRLTGSNLFTQKSSTNRIGSNANIFDIRPAETNTHPLIIIGENNKQNRNLKQHRYTNTNTNTPNSSSRTGASPDKTSSLRPSLPPSFNNTPRTQAKPVFTTNTVGSAAPVLPSARHNTGKIDSYTPSVGKPSVLGQKDIKPGFAQPKGSTNAIDDSGDLYRFKYILDYNGHTETGSRNGNKQGSFYSISDDNVERTIEYIANEFGFQPRIRWRKIDPNEIKSKENTLKDYEFVWFKQP